ncbi:hypothetical protein SEA_EURATIS_23 [Streptomyces phage Euratis]|uniref:Uncharacterized protein n=1 Tax=Streptomyces phage Euratis TaxID=2510569 RepID=A0A411B0Z6_9CAUD|nr:hypothetical protein SEA_EURATIS_23 [Streptomyces phage Euratis]
MNVVSVDSGTVHFADERYAHPFPQFSTQTMAMKKFRFTNAPVTCQTCILKANEGTDTMPPAAKKTAAKKTAAKKTTSAETTDVDGTISDVHATVDQIKAIDPTEEGAHGKATELKKEAEEKIRTLPQGKRTALRKAVSDAYATATTKPEPAEESSKEVALSDDPMEWDGVPALIAHGVKEMRKGVDAGLQLTSAGEQVANVLLTIRQTMVDPETGLPDLVWRMKATRNAAGKVYDDVLKDIAEDDVDRRASHASLIKATQNKASDVLVAWLRGYDRDRAEDMALLREIFPAAADAVEADSELSPEQAIRNLYADKGIELPVRGRTEQMRITRRVEKVQKLTKELEAAEDAGNTARVEELKGAISDTKAELPEDALATLDETTKEKTDAERTTEAVAKLRKDLEAAGKRFAKVKGAAQKRKVKTELYALIREAAKTFDLDLSALEGMDSEG